MKSPVASAILSFFGVHLQMGLLMNIVLGIVGAAVELLDKRGS
jgi:uncharacterized membrane protein YeaQ/YmgE (transglycosylase-associated protein family)